MPVYEYEPVDRECFMCPGRISVIQGINDEPHQFCPGCGLEVKRVISRVVFKVPGSDTLKKDTKGMTTFRKVEKGKWEKIAGEGPDMMVGSKEDLAAIEEEKKKPAKVIDLDAPPD